MTNGKAYRAIIHEMRLYVRYRANNARVKPAIGIGKKCVVSLAAARRLTVRSNYADALDRQANKAFCKGIGGVD